MNLTVKLDGLGRIMIPAVFRKELDIVLESDDYEIPQEETYLSIEKHGECFYIFKSVNTKKENGIARKIDRLGRVVISKEWIEALEWQVGEKLEVKFVPPSAKEKRPHVTIKKLEEA